MNGAQEANTNGVHELVTRGGRETKTNGVQEPKINGVHDSNVNGVHKSNVNGIYTSAKHGIGNDRAPEPIAIIGLSCKFAGDARNPQELWRMMAEGRSAWTEIPSSRFNLHGSFHPNPEKLDTMHVRGGHFIHEDIAHFDAPFFNFSSEAAAALDPQFRLQLESVYEALENAGLSMPVIAGSNTSVFAGLWKHDYRDSMIRDGQSLPKSFELGTGGAFAANRISHFFDFRGASITIDTACSTALVALHQAVQGLRNGDSSMSVVGASNLMLNPDTFKAMGSAGFLSPDGKCFAFDSRANGYGRGEGVSTVIIKRLKDALADGDPVRAIIRETLINQDGKTDSITSPSQAAQVAMMRECYRRARLDPRDTYYCEAHGTGTKIGDPIEARAISTIFQPDRSEGQPLRIGSIKTNIGHTEVTSGLASIIKVTLAMEKGLIPPSINFVKPNPDVNLESAGLKVVTQPEEWPLGRDGVRRASINNSGYGGTNAHVIIESADSVVPRSEVPLPSLKNKTGVLLLSARTEEACKSMVSNLREYLEVRKGVANDEYLTRNVLYTLGQRRTLLPFVAARRVTLSGDVNNVIKDLGSTHFTPVRASRRPRIGMVFTGQGAQWYAMGRELIVAYPCFKASLKEAEDHLRQLGADWSLMEELHRDADTTRVNDTALSIPLCVALQISLVQLFRTWDIIPTAVSSHSSGEIAAAYAVGALSFSSAMAIAYYRAVLAADKSLRKGAVKGGMVAIGTGVEETEPYLERLQSGGRAVIACINSPSSVTVAGDLSAIQEIEDMAKADNVFARKLRVDTAYHSHHMEPIAELYRTALCRHQIQTAEEGDSLASIAFSSAVTGSRISSADELTDPEHWVESLEQPVRLVDAITDMVLGDFDPSGSSVDAIVEVGPHSALGSPLKEILGLPEFNGIQIPYYSCLLRNTNARDSIQDLVANLLRGGYPINLGGVNFPGGKGTQVRVLTDLPSYPWDHKIRHWYEPRVNKIIRERSQPYNDLIGSREPWANPRNPSWRQILRADDAPWVRDHDIFSRTLYPEAGFVCLAIEAMAQLVVIQENSEASAQAEDAVKAVSGYHLRDIDIQQALVVPENAEGVEIQTTLTPASDKAIGLQGWMQFTVASVTIKDPQWTQHVTGMISVDRGDTDETNESPTMVTNESSTSARYFAPDDFYSSLRSVGIKRGPLFQNLKTITQLGRSKASETTFVVADTSVSMSLPHSHVLHPTTLDSVIQAVYATLSEAKLRQEGPKSLKSISKLWVSNKVPREPCHQFKAYSSLSQDNARSIKASVSVTDNDKVSTATSKVLKVEDLVLMSLSDSVDAIPTQQLEPWKKEVCNTIEWAQDMSLATAANLVTLKQQLSIPEDPKEALLVTDLRRICIYFIHDALAALTQAEVEQLDGHHKKYYTWLHDTLEFAKDGKLGPDSAQWTEDNSSERRSRMDEAAKASVNGEMVCQLGPHLAAMLRRETPPLELMMENKLLYKYYSNLLRSDRSFHHASSLLQRLVHKNPHSRILEIGAGTGGETRYALKTLGTAKTGGPLAELYHFTDISAAFFEAAATEFTDWSEIMKFDKLDIERDPASQGFELGSYDIVIACQVLHATKNMVNTMSNVRKLMKPNGTILMVETTQDQTDVQFVFGLLPGWWLSEENERTSSPSLSISHWDRVLKSTGFTGVDLEVHDCESEEMYSMSTIMSTSLPSQPPILASDSIALVTSSISPPPSSWQESLQHSIGNETTGDGDLISVETLEHSTTSVYTGKVCVLLGEISRPLLHDLTSAELEGIKAIVASCKGLLWVTRGGVVESEQPEYGLAAGFMRSLRNEYVGRKFLTLDLDPQMPVWSEKSIYTILRVLKAEFGAIDGNSLNDAPSEFEYAEREGHLLIPRIQKDINRNKTVLPERINYSAKELMSVEPFHQPECPLSMHFGIPGLLDTFSFDNDLRSNICVDNVLAEDMVLIEPRAYGMSFRDTLAALGRIDEPVMGMECAGIIINVGSVAASHGYASGDRVFCLLSGPFASRVCVEWTNVMRIPDTLTFEEAATLPVAFGIALIGLCDVGRLQRGQSVLIHNAAGGVGQAAIMIAQHVGATIFATVGTPQKKDFIASKYDIPTEHIFSSRDTSFVRGVLSATNEHGVDVVLNSLDGLLLQSSFDIVAPFGYFVDIGSRDVERNSSLEMRSFARQASFSSVNLLALMRYRRKEIYRTLTEITRLVMENIIAPIRPITSYPIAEAVKAFELLQSGRNMGRVVLTTGQNETVPVIPRRHKVKLSPGASYLLVGGVGGIGRAVASWMIEHGAKNLIILSRNAGNIEKTGAFVSQMQKTGCRVKAVSCDVSNAEDLAAALQECRRQGLPPIRGVIQGAMVLQDSILDQMTIDDYRTAILPKVNGTWNLHCQFYHADDLDFFVLLSSIVGTLGNASQSNYAAGGTYQDALARWRVARGLPCVSIDLAAVKSIGYVAETAGVSNRMAKLGHMSLDEDVALSLIESAILTPFCAQILAGINVGPGAHWNQDTSSQLGRDARFWALRYRQPQQHNDSTRGGASGDGGGDPLPTRLATASSRNEAERLVSGAIAQKLADVFAVPIDDIDMSKPPGAHGVDSLVATELRNMVRNQVGAEVSSFDIMQSGSLAALAGLAAAKSSFVEASLFG